MNKQITITGTVFHRTNPVSSGEGSNQGRGFLTIVAEKSYTAKDGTDKIMELFYQVETWRVRDLTDVRVGYKVECEIEVEGSLWKEKDTGEPKMGSQKLWINQGQVDFTVPRVFPKMSLKSMLILEENDLETTSLKNQVVANSIANEPEDNDLPF